MDIKHIIALRENKIHPSALVLLVAISKYQSKTFTLMYVGELHAMYQNKGCVPYSYEAIRSLCNSMVRRGLLFKAKDGKYVRYGLKPSAMKLVKRFK